MFSRNAPQNVIVSRLIHDITTPTKRAPEVTWSDSITHHGRRRGQANNPNRAQTEKDPVFFVVVDVVVVVVAVAVVVVVVVVVDVFDVVVVVVVVEW